MKARTVRTPYGLFIIMKRRKMRVEMMDLQGHCYRTYTVHDFFPMHGQDMHHRNARPIRLEMCVTNIANDFDPTSRLDLIWPLNTLFWDNIFGLSSPLRILHWSFFQSDIFELDLTLNFRISSDAPIEIGPCLGILDLREKGFILEHADYTSRRSLRSLSHWLQRVKTSCK